MPIAQWNVLDRAPDGWSAKGAVLAGAPSAGGPECRPSGVPGVDCAIQTFGGLTVCSYHGTWGAFRQRERLDKTRLLDAHF